MSKLNLASVPTKELVSELKKRMKELNDIESLVRERSSAGTFGRTPQSRGAATRWEGWTAYKEKHPKATPAQFFKTKRK